MNVLTMQISGRTVAAGKVTAGLSREALKIQADAIKIARTGTNIIQTPDNLDNIVGMMDDLLALKDRKAWLLCKVYGDQFTLDELESSLTELEIDAEINRIISGIAGIITKN